MVGKRDGAANVNQPPSKEAEGWTLSAAAEAILRGNDFGTYTVPKRGLYPFQWNWDSCLNALGWARLDEARAWQEIEALFGAQWSDGMVPHIVFHVPCASYFPGPDVWRCARTPDTSGITQPPVAATAVRKLMERARDPVRAKGAATRLFPKLLAWHRWFRSARDPHGTGLVAMLHPWETGWDNSPAWDGPLERVPLDGLEAFERKDTTHVDPQHRPSQAHYNAYMALVQCFRAHGYDPDRLYHVSPFRVADLCTNAILLRADRDLLWLAGQLGHPEALEEIETWIRRGDAAFQTLWDDGMQTYRSLDLITGQPLATRSSAAFLAFYGGVVPSGLVGPLLRCFDRWVGSVIFGVPTVPADEPTFDRKRYWRGPLWPIINYLIADGLTRYGFHDRAERIRHDTARVVERSGFFEYFDPIDGAGLGGDAFSWTAAMWLAWLDPATSP
jgi:hypothetical protein